MKTKKFCLCFHKVEKDCESIKGIFDVWGIFDSLERAQRAAKTAILAVITSEAGNVESVTREEDGTVCRIVVNKITQIVIFIKEADEF